MKLHGLLPLALYVTSIPAFAQSIDPAIEAYLEYARAEAVIDSCQISLEDRRNSQQELAEIIASRHRDYPDAQYWYYKGELEYRQHLQFETCPTSEEIAAAHETLNSSAEAVREFGD